MANTANRAATVATTAKGGTDKPAPKGGKAAKGAAPAATDAAPALPAPGDALAWQALYNALPAIAAARAGKYRESAGVLGCATTLYTLTAWGRDAAATGGRGPKGGFTVQALLCAALAQVYSATGTTPGAPVCGAAIAYMLCTTGPLLQALQPRGNGGACKTNAYLPPMPGAPAGAPVLPCPGWVSGYVRGNARLPAGLFNAVAG